MQDLPAADLCANCDTVLVGDYCHACGQQRVQRLTLRDFLGDVVRRIFRFDKAFAVTIGRALRAPGTLIHDYLAGRRSGILDPLHYFISSLFVQFLIASLTRATVPMIERTSSLNWLGSIGGIAAQRIVVVLWLGLMWRALFRQAKYNLAESYVVAIYAFATTGLLWSLLPLIDLVLPMALGEDVHIVAAVTIVIEFAYVAYVIHDFAGLPWWRCALRVAITLSLSYAALLWLIGVDTFSDLFVPPMPAA